jgi:hypothetical protein
MIDGSARVGKSELGPLPTVAAGRRQGRAIRASSNFHFEVIFFRWEGDGRPVAEAAHTVLETFIATPELHSPLRERFHGGYRPGTPFEISPLEAHAALVAAGDELEGELARASLDRAGAYSRSQRPASADEVGVVAEMFGALGRYEVAKLVAQPVPGCPTCGWCGHLFSNWFFGVAWDWCYVVLWREARTAAIVCMTDTD